MALIQYLSRIRFEFGALAHLTDEITRLGMQRPLLVTDPGLVLAGVLQRALDAARPHRPVVYDATPGNPTEAALDACMALWAQHGCDGVIALGGGSPTDLSKAVALLASHGGRLTDYGVRTGGSEGIGRVARQIAIPTAAGTGAEVGRACVMTAHDGQKCVAVNLNMVADTVLCDPELTLGLPASLTAATGIDALSHGVETICSPQVNPPAEAIARDCVARVAKWLPVAVADGSNREARWQMMMAALEGGMALQKGLGGAHAMANPLGAAGFHHGTLIGILLPRILAFNAEAIPEKMAQISELAGDSSGDPSGWVTALVARIGLPARLRDIGVERGSLTGIAASAATDHLSATNPRKVGAAQYGAMLRAAY